MSSKKNSKKKNYQTKKAAVLNQPKHRFHPLAIVAACLAVAMAAGAGYFFTQGAGEPTNFSSQADLPMSNTAPGEAVYPISLFDDGKAHYFQYQANGIDIRYFILKSSDGVIRAAFDACDVCWPAGKGYVQANDEMVCRNCGRRFASVLINEVKGGCNPAPLKRTIQNDRLVIKAEDVLSGQNYFNFRERT